MSEGPGDPRKIEQRVLVDRGGSVRNVIQIAGDVIVEVFTSVRERLRAEREARQRRTMLARVEGRIRQQLDLFDDAARISLRLRRAEMAVTEEGVREASLVAAEGSLLPTFESKGSSLLVLGEPGSGKSTLLLELAREATERARDEAERPLPVVLPLSSWEHGASLVDWIVEELNRNYGVPPRTGRGWLRDERLLLLLDGLDEVRADRRRGCLAAINAFVHDSGFTPIAVTCRAAEYWAMPERLELGLAFEVESLTPEQVIDFFARSDSTRRWPRLGSWCSAIRCSSSWRRRL